MDVKPTDTGKQCELTTSRNYIKMKEYYWLGICRIFVNTSKYVHTGPHLVGK